MQREDAEGCFISFDELYELICHDLQEPPVSILFYHLVHKVPSFLEFITSKSEYLFLPGFCKLLYCSKQIGDEQLYLFLTILLAFSQNVSFMNCLFSLPVSSTDYSFYTDRTDDGAWSVGSLIMVLLVRLLTQHIHKSNDFYLLSSIMAIICNMMQQAFDLDRYTSRKLVELLLYLNKRFQLLKVQLEVLPDDALINNTSELFSFYLDAIASFLTSERPSLNVCFIYELLRQYISVRTITQHPEFNQVTTMIMMVLDYLNAALEVNPESKSASNQIYYNYDVVFNKLGDEVKSWSFMYRKGSAKYEFEDTNSATFFLNYSWDLLKRYAGDLDFE